MADPQNPAPTPRIDVTFGDQPRPVTGGDGGSTPARPQPPRVIFTDPNTPNMVGRQGSVLRERDNGLLEIQYDGLPGTYLTGRALVTVAGDTAAAPARVPQQSVVQSITDDVIADAFMAAQSRQRVPGEYEVYRGENGMGAVRPYTPPPEPTFMDQAVEMAGDIGQGILRGVNEGVVNATKAIGIPGTDLNLDTLANWLTENIGGSYTVDGPEGTAGEIAQGFAEYIPTLAIGFGTAGAAAKAIGGLSSWLQGTAAGAIADYMADPTDATLGDLAVQIGELDNETGEAVRQAFAEALAREEDDSEFEARMKQVGGGLIAGALFDGLLATYRGVKAARTAVPDLYNGFMDRMSMQLSSVSPAEARARTRGGRGQQPEPEGAPDDQASEAGAAVTVKTDAALSIERSLRSQFPAVDVVVSGGRQDGSLEVARIIVPEGARRQGLGTQVMDALTSEADRLNVRLVLDPSADFGGSPARLRQFYKRFGFVENKGRNRDFEISHDMYREPQTPRIEGFENVVHDKPFVIGSVADHPGAHLAKVGYTYRSLGEAEIAAIQATGFALPPPGGKSKGGRMNVKHWSLADGRLYYRPDQLVIRVKNESMDKNTPVRAEDIEVWDAATNTFSPIKDRGNGS